MQYDYRQRPRLVQGPEESWRQEAGRQLSGDFQTYEEFLEDTRLFSERFWVDLDSLGQLEPPQSDNEVVHEDWRRGLFGRVLPRKPNVWLDDVWDFAGTKGLSTMGSTSGGISQPKISALKNRTPRFALMEWDEDGLQRKQSESFARQNKTCVTNSLAQKSNAVRAWPLDIEPQSIAMEKLGDHLAKNVGVSWAELSRDVKGFDGDLVVFLGPKESGLVIWHRISKAGFEALRDRIDRGTVKLHFAPFFVYAADDFDLVPLRLTDLVSRQPGWLTTVLLPGRYHGGADSWDSKPIRDASITLGTQDDLPAALPFRRPKRDLMVDSQGRWRVGPIKLARDESKPDLMMKHFNHKWGRPQKNDLSRLTLAQIRGAESHAPKPRIQPQSERWGPVQQCAGATQLNLFGEGAAQ